MERTGRDVVTGANRMGQQQRGGGGRIAGRNVVAGACLLGREQRGGGIKDGSGWGGGWGGVDSRGGRGSPGRFEGNEIHGYWVTGEIRRLVSSRPQRAKYCHWPGLFFTPHTPARRVLRA